MSACKLFNDGIKALTKASLRHELPAAGYFYNAIFLLREPFRSVFFFEVDFLQRGIYCNVKSFLLL